MRHSPRGPFPISLPVNCKNLNTTNFKLALIQCSLHESCVVYLYCQWWWEHFSALHEYRIWLVSVPMVWESVCPLQSRWFELQRICQISQLCDLHPLQENSRTACFNAQGQNSDATVPLWNNPGGHSWPWNLGSKDITVTHPMVPSLRCDINAQSTAHY